MYIRSYQNSWFEISVSLFKVVIMHCFEFRANERFQPRTTYRNKHDIWIWYINDACRFLIPFYNHTFSFFDSSMFLLTVEESWLPKSYKPSFSAKQLCHPLEQMFSAVGCIQILTLSATRCIVGNELDQNFHPCTYASKRRERTLFQCIFLHLFKLALQMSDEVLEHSDYEFWARICEAPVVLVAELCSSRSSTASATGSLLTVEGLKQSLFWGVSSPPGNVYVSRFQYVRQIVLPSFCRDVTFSVPADLWLWKQTITPW